MANNTIEVSIKDIPEIIDRLKEVEKEIELERKSKQMFIDSLAEMCELVSKKEEEIERLEKRNKEIYEGFMATQEELKEYAEENERLHSIIKEVREYIDKEYEENCIIVDYCDNPITPQDLYSDILEILDKGE